jgi:hypothetical protein
MFKSCLFVFIYLTILSFSLSVHAQIMVSNFTFNEGIKKIKEEDKLLMVIMDAGRGNTDINNSTSKALLDSDASDVNKVAIVIRPATGSPDWDSINKKYFASYEFGTLFFNPGGVLVHRYDAINEHGYAYVVQANHAYVSINLPPAEKQLDSLIKIRFSDLKALKKLIDTRTRCKESCDDLLDPFVNNTLVDSFENYPYFYILAGLAPQLGTSADSILRRVQNFDSNWYKIPSSERAKINQQIITKTLKTAVAGKDITLAAQVAQFSANTLTITSEFKRGKEQYRIMTDFYYKIHDTLKYLETASVFIEKYYMPVSVESLKQVYIDKAKNRYEKEGLKTIYVEGASTENMDYYAEFDIMARLLNRHAWEFYITTTDSFYLKKALGWAKRSLEYNKLPYTMDTYAQLLYVNGDRKSAISAEKDALKEYQKQNLEKSIPKIEKVLDNMKKGLAVINEK